MAVRGSPSWAIFHVRAIGLPRLIEDLEKFEHTGVPEARCTEIKDALKKIIDDTEATTDGFWAPCVSADLHSFRAAYVEWNGRLEGTDLVDRAHRRTAIEKLRATRKSMKRSLDRGKRNDLLATAGDRALADKFYGYFDPITSKHPGMFPGLTAGAKAYAKAIKSDTER